MTLPSAPVAPPASPPGLAGPSPREQTLTQYPDADGYGERDGLRVFYETHGSGEPTVFLRPNGRSYPQGFGRRRSRISGELVTLNASGTVRRRAMPQG